MSAVHAVHGQTPAKRLTQSGSYLILVADFGLA